MKDVAKGVILALVTSAGLMVIPEGLVLPLVAIFMGVAGGVYVGFALKDPEAQEAPIQWAGAIVFAVAAALGLWTSPWWLVAGWAAHAVWDALHHVRTLKTQTSPGYPAFCAAYDLVLAAFLAYWIGAGS